MTEQALATSEPALDKRGKRGTVNEDELVPVRLVKNYRPVGRYNILGYHRDAVKVKDAAGQWHEIEPAGFVEGEMKPPAFAGVGFEGKIWADTFIEVPRSEARVLLSRDIAVRADEI